jgi:tRNA 2-thiouridine synthesizing protein E
MNDISELPVETDTEGYLVDPNDWNEKIAVVLAAHEGIALSEDHWRVIHFMRAWLDEHGAAADARHVMKAIGGDRDTGRARLFELFPLGYVKQACKIAGMRRPRAWSTG